MHGAGFVMLPLRLEEGAAEAPAATASCLQRGGCLHDEPARLKLGNHLSRNTYGGLEFSDTLSRAKICLLSPMHSISLSSLPLYLGPKPTVECCPSSESTRHCNPAVS